MKQSFKILGLIYLILAACAVVFKDSPAAVISAVFGITYTFLAGKGNPVCYLFGVTGSGFYAYLAFHNALWGNLTLYLGYYVPMQILGFFRWKKYLKQGENEIIKISLSAKERLFTFLITLFFALIAICLLYSLHGKNHIIDGITTVFSITGMYFTVRRAIEQWQVWMVVNGLSAFLWSIIALSGERVYSMVIMWTVYFILAIYFYFEWKKEILCINR